MGTESCHLGKERIPPPSTFLVFLGADVGVGVGETVNVGETWEVTPKNGEPPLPKVKDKAATKTIIITIRTGTIYLIFCILYTIYIMTARTHDLIAFASLISVAAYFPPGELNITTGFAALVGNVVGALAPDLDQATNRLWDLLPVGNFFGNIFRNLMLHHRTISHSILGGFIFYKLLVFITPKLLNPAFVSADIVIASIMIGFISHIAADAVTKEGVPLFFPLPFKIGIPPFAALRITTGKFFEKFVVFPGILAYIVWLVANKKEELLSLVKLIHS